MIGILGGMGTQAGLDFCNKLAMLNRGKIDQKYPLFILYNKSNIFTIFDMNLIQKRFIKGCKTSLKMRRFLFSTFLIFNKPF